MTDEERRARVQNAGAEIGKHLAAIEALFAEPVFVTLVVRNPGYSDRTRDVVLTNDPDPQSAVRVIEGLREQPTETFDIEVDARGSMGTRRVPHE
jgi:hypothetical protein